MLVDIDLVVKILATINGLALVALVVLRWCRVTKKCKPIRTAVQEESSPVQETGEEPVRTDPLEVLLRSVELDEIAMRRQRIEQGLSESLHGGHGVSEGQVMPQAASSGRDRQVSVGARAHRV